MAEGNAVMVYLLNIIQSTLPIRHGNIQKENSGLHPKSSISKPAHKIPEQMMKF
jgi:hypothetical protein